MMHDFSEAVLFDQPDNIHEYAYQYFKAMEEGTDFVYRHLPGLHATKLPDKVSLRKTKPPVATVEPKKPKSPAKPGQVAVNDAKYQTGNIPRTNEKMSIMTENKESARP